MASLPPCWINETTFHFMSFLFPFWLFPFFNHITWHRLSSFSLILAADMIEKEMRKLFSIADEKETRLWNRYMSNTFEPLNKPDSTIQDAGLYQGQVGISLVLLPETVWIPLPVFLQESAKKKKREKRRERKVFDKIDTELSKYGLLCRQLLFLSSAKYALVSMTPIR